MSRHLTVSILQMPLGETKDNLDYIEMSVEGLMTKYTRPELIIGVEYGLGEELETIPGPTTQRMSAIAKKHGIYFIPGTMCEAAPEHGEYAFYNSCPIFGPDGTLLHVYRKKAPFRPGEPAQPSGDDDYCILKIPEKDITIGVLICYDQFFPEIARTLALKGAEMIVCPAYDPMEFDHIPDIIPRARALENELFYIWTNGTGTDPFSGSTCCGKSTIVNPEGNIIYQCGYETTTYTTTLNFDHVTDKRQYGADQHLASLLEFNIPYPYSEKIKEAPVFKGWPGLTNSPEEYIERLAKLGIGDLGQKKK